MRELPYSEVGVYLNGKLLPPMSMDFEISEDGAPMQDGPTFTDLVLTGGYVDNTLPVQRFPALWYHPDAPRRKRPRRVAKKIANRGGKLHCHARVSRRRWP